MLHGQTLDCWCNMKTIIILLLSISIFGADIKVGFSPNEGAEDLVLSTIKNAKTTLHVSAYSFTSQTVLNALIGAKKRGVDVSCVVDDSNLLNSGLPVIKQAVQNGIKVRTISVYPIHHDKIIIADGVIVETGSFNYSSAAAHKNSENVIVVNDATIATIYEKHFYDRYMKGKDYK